MESEREGGEKNDFWFFRVSNWVNRGVIYWDGEVWGWSRFGEDDWNICFGYVKNEVFVLYLCRDVKFVIECR